MPISIGGLFSRVVADASQDICLTNHENNRLSQQYSNSNNNDNFKYQQHQKHQEYQQHQHQQQKNQ